MTTLTLQNSSPDPFKGLFRLFSPNKKEVGACRVRKRRGKMEVAIFLPGFIRDDLTIYCRDGFLHVSGLLSRQELLKLYNFPKSNFYYHRIKLPTGIQPETLAYQYQDRELIIELKKA